MLGSGSLSYPRRGPSYGLWVSPLPGGDVYVVELVGRDEVPNPTKGVDLRTQSLNKFCGRPQKQLSAPKANDNHASWERDRGSKISHPDKRTIDDPNILAKRLQRVDRLVELHNAAQNNMALLLPEIVLILVAVKPSGKCAV
jgi:hypothetical protein